MELCTDLACQHEPEAVLPCLHIVGLVTALASAMAAITHTHLLGNTLAIAINKGCSIS